MEIIKSYLVKFVSGHAIVYGKHSIVTNVHALLHICDDVERFGNLNKFSAFPFENYLFFIRRKVRGGSNALQQLVNRIEEHEHFDEQITRKRNTVESEFELSGNHICGPISDDINADLYNQFTVLKTKHFVLNCKKIKDSIIIISSDNIVMRVTNILQEKHSKKVFVVGRKYVEVSDLYAYPTPSRNIGIHKVERLEGNHSLIDVAKVSH